MPLLFSILSTLLMGGKKFPFPDIPKKAPCPNCPQKQDILKTSPPHKYSFPKAIATKGVPLKKCRQKGMRP